MENVQIINFKINCNEDGVLIALENNKEIPFDIKRIFYIYGTKQSIVRGKHANKYSRFLLISVNGSCKVKTHDGKIEKNFVLDDPSKGLFLDRMVWKDMYDFSSDCVLLVLTDVPYDDTEYVRDFDEFLKIKS